MSADRWQALDAIYHRALDLDPSARPAFLDQACGDDAALREEIASLLRYATPADAFLQQSALDEAADAVNRVRASLAGRQIGDYRVIERIGAGGMGDVYQARDLRLGRDVALKVMVRSPFAGSADPLVVEREARAASALSHPGIVTIYNVGDEGDLGYIAMELVQGRTLRDLLRDERLPFAVALDLAIQLADALAAAHATGIVHRDLKPDNIMVTTDHRVKILDFGIARRQRAQAIGVPSDPDDASSGRPLMGTAGYMSPEQARGQPGGPASDQFAFGIVLRELCGGVPSAAVAALIRRCVEDDPSARFAQMDDVAAELRRLLGDNARRGVTRRRALWLAAGGAVAATAGLTWRLWPEPPAVHSVAVLPLENVPDDTALDYLCEGLPRALRERLAQLSTLHVLSGPHGLRTNSPAGAPPSPQALGVDAVVGGSLTRIDGQVVVQLLVRSVRSGGPWTATYRAGAGGIQGLRDTMLADLAGPALALTMSDADRRGLAATDTRTPDAFDLFLRAFHAHQAGREDDLIEERALLGRAVAIDPGFARAYAALASTYTVMAIEGWESPREAFPETNRYLRRALELDAGLPDAHAETAAYEFFCNWQWAEADRAWEAAETASHGRLQPDLLISRALQRWARGRTEDALALVRQARQVDHLSPAFMINEADYLLRLDRLDEAAALYTSASRAAPEDPNAYFGLAEVRRLQHRPDDAIAASRQGHVAHDDPIPAEVFDRARGVEGLASIQTIGAEIELRRLERRGVLQYVSPLDLARAHAQLGPSHRSAALKYLEQALDDQSPGLVFLAVDRTWDAFRSDSRFTRVAASVGLG